ncbi:MAG TPA: coniferyl aldehyde dehydrogenase [Pseudomonadales bacterium]|nr:coniferyl aldehyde dehydrogenase [Pseudomonadales bacterium]
MFHTPVDQLPVLLDRQRRAFEREAVVSPVTRINRIDRVISLLVDNQVALCEATSTDFGNRSQHQARMADIFGSLNSLNYAKKNMQRWMKPEKRHVDFPLNILGAKAAVHYQPKGVIGAIATWNFPVWVPMSSLGAIFAAGNRCMLKLSEFTPHTSALLQQLISQYFDPEELVAVTGEQDVGAAFAALPFDHILFTGATSVGKHILHAAADNLTPVTLELGGKSPVVVGRNADLKKAGKAIAIGKALNMGQVCLSPDYVLVHSASLNELIAEIENAFAEQFPTIRDNPDYTSMVNARHYARLQGYIDDAKAQDGEIRVVNPAKESFAMQKEGVHKIPPTLIIEPKESMKVMQEEIFGPLLPIKSYNHIDDAIEYINAHPRPLGLYLFSDDAREKERVLSRTISGGVAINDVMQHVSCEDLPFGGIGASGMGSYHGVEGFKTFSHGRAVYTQSRINMVQVMGMKPPYTDKVNKILDSMIKK